MGTDWVSFGNDVKVLEIMVVMVMQHFEFAELCTQNKWVLWYVGDASIKLLNEWINRGYAKSVVTAMA